MTCSYNGITVGCNLSDAGSKVTIINKHMNYTKHYNILIDRAKNRILDEYTENHHIIPRCLGGNNTKENIVSLTAREHYVAHQLLVKMNPTHSGLINAGTMMATAKNINIQRFNNRLYEWVRIKHSAAMSALQTGKKNSQYGTCWMANIVKEVSIKINKKDLESYIEQGWIKKRIIDFDLYKKSIICREFEVKKQKYSTQKKEYEALRLYELFNAGNYSSIREFARLNKTYSAQYISRLWKQCIPEFNPKRRHAYSIKV